MRRFFYLGGVLLLIIIYLLALSVSRNGETRVAIHVIPDDSQVLLNDQSIKPGTHYLRPDRYTFIAKKAGFKDDAQTVTVKAEVVDVNLIPEPDSYEARQYLADNPDVQAAREAIGGQRANQKGLQLEQKTPLIKLLPYTDISGPFSIDYGPSDKQKDGIVIVVSNSSADGRVNAIKWIKQQGYNPADMEIRFEDFNNPLEGNQ